MRLVFYKDKEKNTKVNLLQDGTVILRGVTHEVALPKVLQDLPDDGVYEEIAGFPCTVVGPITGKALREMFAKVTIQNKLPSLLPLWCAGFGFNSDWLLEDKRFMHEIAVKDPVGCMQAFRPVVIRCSSELTPEDYNKILGDASKLELIMLLRKAFENADA
jgi:hypothetical protein